MRRPVVVSRSVPQPSVFGRHRPSRACVMRTSARWPCQKATMNQRGGSRPWPLPARAALRPRVLGTTRSWPLRALLARVEGLDLSARRVERPLPLLTAGKNESCRPILALGRSRVVVAAVMSCPERASAHATTEFEFHMSPARRAASRPQVNAGHLARESRGRRADPFGRLRLSRCGLSTASAMSGMCPPWPAADLVLERAVNRPSQCAHLRGPGRRTPRSTASTFQTGPIFDRVCHPVEAHLER